MDEQYAVVDFETFGIGARPEVYPPKPVGVAIRWPDGKSEYLAWGHPHDDGKGNNATLEVAIRAVRRAFTQCIPIFHNAKFDLEVAWQHLGIPFPKQWHDTLLLAYLHSPDERRFALKPMSEKFLKWAPEERDEVREWVLKNVKGAKKSTWGAYIAFAPVALVGPYAIGDVERTWRLFNFMAQSVFDKMPVPYTRERRLLPHLVAAERRGIRVHRELLQQWEVELTGSLHHCDAQIRAKLNAPELEIDSDDQLALALDSQNLMTHWETPDGVPFAAVAKQLPVTVAQPFGAPEVVVVTEKLTRSVSKDALARCCTDKDLVQQLAYRNAAATMLRVFVKPWLEKSEKDGRLHTEWHQVRGQEKNGTRTGRIASANPNFTNVPNPNETPPPFGLLPLPSLRQALLPEEGCLWISADYSQQELRITSHYENGQMKDAYIADPALDLHAFAQKLILERVGKAVSRKHVKNVAFASIYGAGIPKLARMMGVTDFEAEEIRDAYFAALPGLKRLIRAVLKRTTENKFVPSLGGRQMMVEPPTVDDDGRRRTYEYKQTNKLIQGSAADMTKEAIAQYCESGGSNYFLSQVYDEINISVPYAHVEEQAAVLRACMVNAMPLSVPILVDIECGPNWHDLTTLELP